MRSKYFIFLLFSSLTLVFSQVQDSKELEKNDQQFQKDQVEFPDWVDPETGIDRTTNLPYVKIPYKPAEPLAKVSLNPNNPSPGLGEQILIIVNLTYTTNDRDNIKSNAEAAGHTVTSSDSYPSDVSSYDQIWDLRFVDAMSSSDQTKLKTVLQNGGTVYLTGENGHSLFAARNAAILSFIKDVGGGSSVAIGGYGTHGIQIVQSDFRTPNNITNVYAPAPGYFSNLGNGTAITLNSSDQQPISAVWEGSDLSSSYTGKIIVMLDWNIWHVPYISSYGGDNVEFLQNMIALAAIHPTTINSAALAADNTYIDVTMNAAVYNANGGSGALEATDFTLTFAQNSGSATGVSISSVKKNDNTAEGSATALSGGETVIRVFLSISGTPSGVETITITPANGSSIYNATGLAMASSQTTGCLLYTSPSPRD